MEANFILYVLLVILIVSSSSKADDDQTMCKLSKEEQLLDKAIRMEVKVEAMLSEIRKTEEHVLSVLEYRKQEVQKTLSELKETQAIQGTKIDEVTTNYDDLKENISAAQGHVIETPVIAFQAHTLKDTSISNGQTLTFLTTVYDTSCNYNNNTGVYTAPVSGVYMFNVQLCIAVGKFAYVEIVHENVTIIKVRFVDEGETYHSCSTVTGVAVLNKGERVWVKSIESTQGLNNVWENSEIIWNSFSGVLINTNN